MTESRLRKIVDRNERSQENKEVERIHEKILAMIARQT